MPGEVITQQEVGEVTPEEGEKVEVSKAEYEEMRSRLLNAEGYTKRIVEKAVQKTKDEADAEIAEVKKRFAGSGDGGDNSVKDELFKFNVELEARAKDLKERETAIMGRGLQVKALSLATEHRLTPEETAKLADAKTEVEMENIALKFAINRQGRGVSPSILREVGRAVGGSINRREIQEKLRDPSSLSKEDREKYIKAFTEGRVTE